MLTKELTIVNRLGLHARAAAKLAKTASGFGARIQLVIGNQQANAKSIMSVMMLAATKGTPLTVIADGADEEMAMLALESLITNGFGERE